MAAPHNAHALTPKVVSFDNQLLVHSPIVLIEWANQPGWPIKSISANFASVLPLKANAFSHTVRYADYVHPDDLAHLATEVPTYIAKQKKQWQQHYRLKDGDGGFLWVHDHTFAEYDARGELTRLNGFLYDQTQLVCSLQNERLSTERFQHVLNLTGTLVWECDQSSAIHFINENVCQIIGFLAAELREGHALTDLMPRRDQATQLQSALATEQAFHNIEHQITLASGEHRWFSSSAKPLFDEMGRFTGLFRGVSIDTSFQKEHEKQLSDNETRWRSVLEATGQGVWDWNAQTGQVYFSPLWKSMLGYAVHEVGDTLSEWDSRLHPDDVQQVYADLQQHLSGDTDFYDNIHRVKHKSGHWIWIQDRGRVFSRDSEGQPLRVIGTHTDVTAQQEEKNRLIRLAESLPGALYQFCLHPDGSTSFPFSTPGIGHIYECTPEEVINDAAIVFSRIHPKDLAAVTDSIQQSAESLRPWLLEYRVQLPSRGLRWLRGQANPQKLDDGSVIWHGYISDITAERVQREELIRYQSQYRLAMEATQIGIWTWDMTSDTISWTDETYTLLGYAPNAFPVDFDRFMALIKSEDAVGLLDRIMEQIKQQGHFQVQFRMASAQGSWVWIEGRGRVTQYDLNGNPCTMMGTHADITRNKQVEADLNCAREAAEAATKVKANLLSTVSHEIRTPLGGIIGLSQQALEQKELEHSQQTLRKVKRSADQLLHILNDTLDYSKIESGKLQRYDSPFNLQELSQEVIDLFQPSAKAKGIKLVTQLDIARCQVVSDELRLRQVLTNLISNAVKFTDQGSVTLSVNLPEIQATDNPSGAATELHIAVSDTGTGMTEQVQQQLFKAFQQGEAHTAHRHGGTGLGLMISKHLVKLLGGDHIELTSQPGKGACFSFSIPVTLPEAPAAASTAQQTEDGPQFSGRVLLVDDIEINRDIMRHQLLKFGLAVIEAQNGQEAVDLILSNPAFDLVLMDLNMPVLDGYAASEQIHNIQPELPIIALTASFPGELARDIQGAGMTDCLTKPVSQKQLSTLISHYLTSLPNRTTGAVSSETASPVSSALSSDQTSSVADFSGVRALFAGNDALYIQLLEDFNQDMKERYSQVIRQLQKIIDDPALKTSEHFLQLHKETHALKGTSANLGLTLLASTAAEVDQAVRQELLPSPTAITAFHRAIEQSISTVSLYVQTLRQEQPCPGPQAHKTSTAPVSTEQLNQLRTAIQANEFIDNQLLQGIRHGLPDSLQAQWQRVVSALDQLDFSAAEQHLSTLAEHLD